MFPRHDAVAFRRDRQQRRQFFFVARRKIAEHDAAVSGVPVVLQMDKAHIHSALLDEAAKQAEGVEPFHHFRRDVDFLDRHFHGLRHAPHEEGHCLDLRVVRSAPVLRREFLAQKPRNRLVHEAPLPLRAPFQSFPALLVLGLEPHAEQHRENALVFRKRLRERRHIRCIAVQGRAVRPGLQHVVAPVRQKPQPGKLHEPTEPLLHQRRQRSGRPLGQRQQVKLRVLDGVNHHVDHAELVHRGKRRLPRGKLRQEHLPERILLFRDGINFSFTRRQHNIHFFIRQRIPFPCGKLHGDSPPRETISPASLLPVFPALFPRSACGKGRRASSFPDAFPARRLCPFPAR